MSKVVFIKQNSTETRKKLENAGYSVCACADFEDSIWLSYYPECDFYRDIHGIGYTDEVEGLTDLTPIERINTWLQLKGWFSEEREFFEDVDSFLDAYPKTKELNQYENSNH